VTLAPLLLARWRPRELSGPPTKTPGIAEFDR